MNKIYILILLLFSISIATGQNRPDKEKIRTLKIAFITEKLDLSSKEAEAFWPIYNNHEAKMEDLRHKERIEIHSKLIDGSINTLSDKEVNNILEKHLFLEDKKQALNKQFIEKLRNVISAKKIILLIQSERGFKRKLIKQYRDRHRMKEK